MSASDKISNAAQDLAGKAKEAAGGAKDDEGLRREGQKDQAAADLKQRGEHVKDAFKG
ncbi:CsbD family protein [Kineococcus sp. SYSU DK002]|uniref:CsbD family protein n=1 Tax=Kineococcus sp. SYSU DK002 TaxID=3383123 RepID=UPI003D7F18C9